MGREAKIHKGCGTRTPCALPPAFSTRARPTWRYEVIIFYRTTSSWDKRKTRCTMVVLLMCWCWCTPPHTHTHTFSLIYHSICQIITIQAVAIYTPNDLYVIAGRGSLLYGHTDWYIPSNGKGSRTFQKFFGPPRKWKGPMK